MMRSAADFDTPKRGASCRRVRFVRQYAATSSTRSSSGRLHGRPLRTGGGTLAPQHRDQFAELTWAQPRERGYSGRLRHRDHISHHEIIAEVPRLDCPLHGARCTNGWYRLNTPYPEFNTESPRCARPTAKSCPERRLEARVSTPLGSRQRTRRGNVTAACCKILQECCERLASAVPPDPPLWIRGGGPLTGASEGT